MTSYYPIHHRLILTSLLFVLGFSLQSPLIAQERGHQHPKIEQYLNPDGTLKKEGLPSGPIEAEGWQVETNSDGELHFISPPTSSPFSPQSASVPEDAYWDDRFGDVPGASGVNDEIFAMTSDNQMLYMGGAFTRAGELTVNNMTTWDGTKWGLVGKGAGKQNGVHGIVNAMKILYGNLYTGGQFDSAGGKSMQNIGAYDTKTREWNSIGDVTAREGFASVNAICIDGDNVYIGGTFDKVGTILANNVAAYNVAAKRWFTLGTGTDGTVSALEVGPDGIYVGGSFSSAGGVPSNSIARWDGGQWHGLAGGVDGYVNAIAVMGETVFVGGEFGRAGDTVVTNIARWRPDTTTWTRLTGIYYLNAEPPVITRLSEDGVNGVVRTLLVQGSNLLVGGTFTSAYPGDMTTSPVSARYVARWFEWPDDPKLNTTWWKGLGQRGMNGFVNVLELFDGSVYAAGSFTQADRISADGIARYDATRKIWRNLASGAGNNIFALDADGGEIWVGGEFNQPGIGIGTRLGTLDGDRWDLIPGLFNGSIFNVASHDNWVYVCGHFDRVGNLSARNVVRFNKTTRQWETLGNLPGPQADSFYDFVASLTFDGDDIYIGGDFISAGDVTAFSIVKWNSQTDTWTALKRGINGQVFSIIKDGDEIYAGGRFLGAGDLVNGKAIKARNIALLTDGDWQTLEEGVDEVIWAMVQKDDRIYMGGNFDSAGTMAAGRFVAWNITTKAWEPIGSGLYDEFLPTVSSLTTDGRMIYAGGNFTQTRPGGDSLRYIARWDGGRWNPLGSGLNNYVYVIDVDGPKVYVAGAFDEAGEKSSLYFGIYTDPFLSVGHETKGTTLRLGQVAPNPFGSGSHIRFETAEHNHVALTIYSIEGKEIERLIDRELPAGDHHLFWEPDQSLPSGTYIVQLKTGKEMLSQKIIKE